MVELELENASNSPRDKMRVLSIGLFAALGALFRWWLTLIIDPLFPILRFGVLASNIIGCYLVGIVLGLKCNISSDTLWLGLTVGFLGGLTTFSAFSETTINLFLKHQYLFGGINIVLNLAGSLVAILLGFYTIKCLS